MMNKYLLLGLLMAGIPICGADLELSRNARQGNMIQCQICRDDKDTQECVTLTCNHTFCRDCLGGMVNIAVREHNNAQLRCPEPACAQAIAQADLARITNNRGAVDAVSERAARDWLLTQPGAKQCPTRDCNYAFINDENSRESVNCPECQQQYCSSCLVNHPVRVTCEQVAAVPSDRETAEWVRVNTKPCPQCNVRIERNQGCLHMTCRSCWHEFCWSCNRPWRGHGDFYSCNNSAVDNNDVLNNEMIRNLPTARPLEPQRPPQEEQRLPMQPARRAVEQRRPQESEVEYALRRINGWYQPAREVILQVDRVTADQTAAGEDFARLLMQADEEARPVQPVRRPVVQRTPQEDAFEDALRLQIEELNAQPQQQALPARVVDIMQDEAYAYALHLELNQVDAI